MVFLTNKSYLQSFYWRLFSPGIDELQAVSLTFVNDLDVPEVQVQDLQQQDEYETDSDTDGGDEVDFEVVSKPGWARRYLISNRRGLGTSL